MKDSDSICFLSPTAYGYFTNDGEIAGGGAQRQLHLIATNQSDKYDISFIVGDYGQRKQISVDGVDLIKAHSPDPNANIWDRMTQLRDLYVAMKLADADIYVHRGKPDHAIAYYLLTSKLGRDFVYNVANDADITSRYRQLSPVSKYFFSRSINGARTVIAQTSRQKTILNNYFTLDVKVVPNGYPTSDEIKKYENRKFFLWIGRLNNEQKRPHLLIEIAKSTPSADFVMIASKTSDKDYGDRVIRMAKNVENIELLTDVNPSEVHDYFAHAIAVINTSRFEGFPNTFLEAWRMGTPVLTLDINITRFLTNTTPDFRCRSPEKLQERLKELDTDLNYRRELGEACLRNFKEQYEIERVATQYIQAVLNNSSD